MRRSVRLAAKSVTELTSQTTKAAKGPGEVDNTAVGQTSTYENNLKSKQKSKTSQKRTAVKRKRKGSSTEEEENREKKGTENLLKKTTTTPSKTARKVTDEGLSYPDTIPANKESVIAQEKYLGAHVSISGGLHNAVSEALEIGAKAFGLFLRSQRQWSSKPLQDKDAEMFREACICGGFPPHTILPHGIYLMNCGSPDEDTLSKSRSTLVDELNRCEKLGLCMYNFHPGSTCGKIPIDECLDRIGDSINQAHRQTKYVITVLENMSCQGNTVGGNFEELRGIIDRVHDKSRMGVCLDTCHAYAAGHNLALDSGYDKMMDEFDDVIGLKYLRAVHLNDSKGDLGCHLDRHENIGKGKIGFKAFERLMKDPRFNGIPLILETPCASDDTYKKEIRKLYSVLK